MVLIYLYISIRSKVPNFFAHLKYIQEFTSAYTQKIDLGFYMATYERALLTMTDEDEDRKTMIIDMKKGSRRTNGRESERGTLKKSLIGSLSLQSIIKRSADPF